MLGRIVCGLLAAAAGMGLCFGFWTFLPVDFVPLAGSLFLILLAALYVGSWFTAKDATGIFIRGFSFGASLHMGLLMGLISIFALAAAGQAESLALPAIALTCILAGFAFAALHSLYLLLSAIFNPKDSEAQAKS